MKICIQVCSNQEWQAMSEILPATESECLRQRYVYGEYFTYKLIEKEIIVFHSGYSKTKAAAAAEFIISTEKPDLFLVFGTAGGIEIGLEKLDLVIPNRVAQYDCLDKFKKADEIISNDLYFDSNLDIMVNDDWFDLEDFPEIKKRGLIATADQIADYETMIKLRKLSVMAADWESGAIAYVAQAHQQKYLMVRGISDIPSQIGNEDAQQQFLDYQKNTKMIMQKLFLEFLPRLIESNLL